MDGQVLSSFLNGSDAGRQTTALPCPALPWCCRSVLTRVSSSPCPTARWRTAASSTGVAASACTNTNVRDSGHICRADAWRVRDDPPAWPPTTFFRGKVCTHWERAGWPPLHARPRGWSRVPRMLAAEVLAAGPTPVQRVMTFSVKLDRELEPRLQVRPEAVQLPARGSGRAQRARLSHCSWHVHAAIHSRHCRRGSMLRFCQPRHTRVPAQEIRSALLEHLLTIVEAHEREQAGEQAAGYGGSAGHLSNPLG